MDLFASTPTQIVADAEGGIRYWPNVVEAALADAWFKALLKGCCRTACAGGFELRVVRPRSAAFFSFSLLRNKQRAALSVASFIVSADVEMVAPCAGTSQTVPLRDRLESDKSARERRVKNKNAREIKAPSRASAISFCASHMSPCCPLYASAS